MTMLSDVLKRISGRRPGLRQIRGLRGPRAADAFVGYEPSQEFRRLLEKHPLGPALMAEAVLARGARIEWLNGYAFIARWRSTELVFWDCRCNDASAAAKIAGRKDLTRKVLERRGVRIPAGGTARTLAEALAIWKTLAKPVVIKPRSGSKGRNVSIGMNTPGEIETAFLRAGQPGGVVVKEKVEGQEYRVLVVGSTVVAVSGKDAPNVVGDGASTVEELIKAKNIRRLGNPHLATRPIVMDEHVQEKIRHHGLTPQSVLPNNKKIYLRDTSNFSSGGDSMDCTDAVSSEAKAAAVDAVTAIPGLVWAGVDMIVPHSGAAPRAGWILEVNTNPGPGAHHFPLQGQARNVAAAMVQAALAH